MPDFSLSDHCHEMVITRAQEVKQLLLPLGEPYSIHVEHIDELINRLREEKLHLAIVGQFKRGKSSLINAFIGADILPTSSIPVTAIPTFIRWGSVRKAFIRFEQREDMEQEFISDEELSVYLELYVTEQGNPQNKLGVSQVEVEYPSSFLIGGVNVIDTPGIGSTHKHNTEVTVNFLMQCDAAIFVLSSDPPITAGEVEFLHDVSTHVHRLFFVLNKADYLDASERNKVVAFLRDVLRSDAGFSSETIIYTVSAKTAAKAKRDGDSRLLEESGFMSLEADLENFFQQEKKNVLQAAITAKLNVVFQQARMDIALSLQALKLPLTELESKQELLDQKLAEIQKQALTAADLLVGDRRRAKEFLEEKSNEMRLRAKNHLQSVVDKVLGNGDRPGIEKETHEALAKAIPEFFVKELNGTANAFQAYVAAILKPHQQKADELVGAVRKAASEVFDFHYTDVLSADAFTMKRQPYWVTDQWRVGFGEVPKEWIEIFLPRKLRLSRIRQRLDRHIHNLVQRNVENLRWATLQNVDAAFQDFSGELQRRLTQAIHSTKQAIQSASSLREDKKQSAEAEILKLEQCSTTLQTIIENVASMIIDGSK